MSTCPEDTYVMCGMPTTPVPEVVTITVQTVDEPLPATGVDPGAAVGFTLLGVALIGTAVVMLARERRR